MKHWFAALIGSVALVACGIVHGYWTDRWTAPADTEQAAQRLETIPLQVGDWDGEVLPVRPGEAGAGVAGWIRRRYVNRQTGAVVKILLVCGRFGPVSIHDPETCYGAIGYMVGNKERYEAGPGDSTWKSDAIRASASEETRLRLYWGWNDGTGWSASEKPREQYVRRPVLHKLYVVREVNGVNELQRSEPCEDFLQALLPVLRGTLFTPI